MNVEGTSKNHNSQPFPNERGGIKQGGDSERDPQPPRKGWRRFLVPALIMAAILGGVGWIVFNRFIMPILIFTSMKPQLTEVELSQPKTAPIADSSDYAANLDSRQSVTLQPRVSGQIAAIYVRAGDRVEAGTPIIQIDAAQQRAQVAGRDAAVESAATDITAAQAEVVSARETLRSLQARRIANLSDVQLNQSEYQRYQDLFTQGASSKQVLDQRLNALQTARANLSQTEADIQAQQSIISRSQATVAKSQRALQQAQANVTEGQAELQYYTIKAPFSGVVGNIPVKVGDFVDNASPLLRITQNEQLEVQMQIPLERSSALRLGLPVQLLDEKGKVLQTGKLSFIAPDVDASTQSVQAKAVFNNSSGALRTSQFARVRVVWATRPGVLVPTTAISRLAGKNFVFVGTPFKASGCKAASAGEGAPPPTNVDPNQLVIAQKPVQLGRIVGNDQEVLDGLSASDRIATSGILSLQNCLLIQAAAPK
ncbi:efflux RND transporter periplasmic adaptor subunit [Phormidium sp. FACHB-592]|uniref:Efflux RND transporter periplasmic adaptor subunit n=1 Tax=Stenomitos frigidus AS-A4 TaxID=2933935 RepID=A0ABV0KL31_9CYAN|nr:efflux RND transporter periplasmic adaptor subunit [Phormidium sp. FACHB-592]MBD2075766.1 efflux RND transporter periplasmic adaptor subunit [Phormidium sp. FACHB-592]